MALLGIDEVGRGPLAGPLVVGAVILPDSKPEWVTELKDSKKLSARKRERLAEMIWAEALAVGLGWVTPVEIDAEGVSGALRLATRRAVEEVRRSKAPFSEIVIDGKVNFLAGTGLGRYVSVMVKADDLVKEVSAASIVAKCARDKYMIEMAGRFPVYGFDKHMGYGTEMHRAAIREYGVCPEHRLSFEPCKSLVGYQRENTVVKNTTVIGGRGEDAVVEYLERAGHEVVERNFRTYYYEIDIISVKDGRVYFTEVKTRKDGVRGGGLAAVDARKLKRMRFAAECYLQYRRLECDARLAVAAVNGNYAVEDWVLVE